MISANLKGRTALVTGGASGIGLATVELFARSGARVAMNHRPGNPRGAEQIERLRSQGMDVIAATGDVAIPGEAEKMVRTAIDRLGRLDILVNNAGTAGTPQPIPLGNFDAISEDFWQTLLSTNLVAPFRCTHAAANALREAQGAVVNTASIAGLGFVGSSIAYGATKAGLVNLTRNLARALAPDVRVNAVAPGLVDSPWIDAWPEERKKALVERTPLGRICTSDDIAEAILFLAAGGAMITGQVLVVDGGLSL